MGKTKYRRKDKNQEALMVLDINEGMRTKCQLILDRIRESEDSNNLSPVFNSMEEAKAWIEA